jgi:hypothetical protein
MKTDDFIAMLATGAESVSPHEPERRVGTALLLSLPVAFLTVLVFGIRPDFVEAMANPMFWVKFAFPGSTGLISLLLMLRLSRPGMPAGSLPRTLLLPGLLMSILAVVALAGAARSQHTSLVLGTTWQVCTFNIALVGTPVFVGTFWALKGLAPTRLSLAGAVAGLFAGAAGAFVYAVHCPEMDAPFLLVWNGLGMLALAGLGAALGPRLLRW